MYKKLQRLTLSLMLLWIASPAIAQSIKNIDLGMTEVPRADLLGLGTPQIKAAHARMYQLDVDALKAELIGISHREVPQSGFVAEVNFPHPDGTMHTYSARENSTIDPTLGALYDIHSYDANGTDGAFIKWDITEHGFHAMIRKPGESTIFIDPLFKGNTQYYIVYYKKDFSTDKVMGCSFDMDQAAISSKTIPTTGTVSQFGTCELRTYRLALSATGEYTTFHGGTVAAAQAAQVTTMNRVNGVYEKDMAITMTIIANNNLIVYTNSGSDPFTNGNPGTMINQNQSNTDAVIGNGNYDIGHVFGTNSGGLAGLGVVCNNSQKARGVTGSGAPIGDPFDIDYVAHEMGHQFGAPHTFNNSCGGNRNNATAVEPGSGSTIMAYAGICPSNVQNNSDDHFHGVSLEDIHDEIMSGGHTCEVITPLANIAPTLVSTNGGAVVPASTPFALTAVVTDPDGDPLTYNWEQMDIDISTQPPVATATGGPNFRSNPSLSSPTRYFPNLADLTAGGPFTWEVLSSVSRVMDFRVTVRDNAPGPGGCNDHGDVTVTVDGNSGPFVVTYPSNTGIVWAGATTETVTWSVAGSDLAPVNCTNVDILLSTDGGLTYPTVLLANTANDGTQLINVPNLATTTARIMIISAAGTFFDISDNDFEITMATFDYTLSSSTPTVSVCQPTDAVFTIDVGSIGGYNDPVTLSVTGVPAGAIAVFSTNPVTPVGTSTLTISNTGAVTPGTYALTVQGVSTSGAKTTDLTLNISSGSPSATTLSTPVNLAVSVTVPTDFVWVAAPGAGITYDIDIATDAGFATIVDQATALATTTYNSAGLLGATTYYWRVRAVTGCGTSSWSTAWSFTTSTCSNLVSTDVGQTTDVASFTSVIVVTGAGIISDVNISSLDISHPWVGDLRAELMSPTGTVVSLFDQPGIPGSTWGCAGDDIDVSFDDGAVSTAVDFDAACGATAPTISGPYQSIDVLSVFNGESITGTWTLTVYDEYTAGDDGILNAWSLELCTVPSTCVDPDIATIAGSNSVCEGNTITLSIGSGNLNDAIDWNWYSGSCGGTLEGTGSTLAVSPLTSTSYFVRGEGGCVIPGACVQFDVTVNPISNSAELVQICTGQTHTYPDGSSGTVSEVHTSTLVSAQGCDSIIVTTLDVVTGFNLNASATICNGDTYTFPDGTTGTTAQNQTSTLVSSGGCDSIIVTTLDVAANFNSTANATICDGDTYTFPDGTTGTTAQSQTSVLMSSEGCDSTIVTTLAVSTVDVSVTQTLPTITANATGATYQWVDCNNGNANIAGATSASYTPTADVGNYAVMVTENGCTDISACVLVDQTGINELTANNVLVYPNPTSDKVSVTWDGTINYIEVTDVRGRLLNRVEVSGLNETQLDVASYKSGIYLLHIVGDNGRTVIDLIKQ
ncbi:MAG: proprotein convertase P-domain-containing protein [Crocinitomicaceae bacterium]|nr:proprotein convertase P-domain-containing protein [Crocinitomicaceae bacterium]